MKFKAAHMIAQYDALPNKMKEVCEMFDQLSKDNKITAVVTRVCDPVEGESGVHLDHRAVDFRNQYFDGKSLRCLYSVELVEEIVDTLNNAFQRQDKFKTAISHSFQGGMIHFHLQIPAAWLTEADQKRITAFINNLKIKADLDHSC